MNRRSRCAVDMHIQQSDASRPALPGVGPGDLRNIVAFVGDNENGILREISASFMSFAEAFGYAGHVIDLQMDGWVEHLGPLIEEGIAVAWGAAGIGAGLHLEGKSLWDEFQVPFVSVMSDSPSWKPMNHHVDARFVANGYQFQDWLDMQRSLVRSPQISSLLPLAVLPNPHRDAVPWSRRGNRMLFVKTGTDPESHRAAWKGLPPRFRDILEEASAAALAAPVGDVLPFLLDALRVHGLYVEGRLDVLFGLLKQVDIYLRDMRSTLLARALLPFPAEIVGRGWDHVSDLPGRAKFTAAMDARALPGIYGDAQFLFNTMPNFSHRTHERVLSGFASRCCVVTNENADMHLRFSSLPSYLPLDLSSPDLSDQIAALLKLGEDADTTPALDVVESEFRPELFLHGLLSLAGEVRAASTPYFAEHGLSAPAAAGQG